MSFGKIGSDESCYVIAEAGLNHNGSMGVAKKLIDVAVIAGADAVKFQKRTVDKLAVKKVLDAKDDRFPGFGSTYREIRDHLEFNLEQYKELKEYAEVRGIDFVVTAFDVEAAELLHELGIDIYKLASHSVTNIELIEYLASNNRKTVLSTGMAELEEIRTAVDIYKKHDTQLVLLHCVSAYPTPLDQCNMHAMKTLGDEFGLPVGYSGHELGYLPTLVAAAMGAVAVERHYTLDKNMEGFDHKISLEPDELISMVRDIRAISAIQGDGSKAVSETEMITRNKYHVSMASSQPIAKGTIITRDMVRYRNPGTGIPAKKENQVIGKRAVNDIQEDILLNLDMFE
jgi:sialic acid synthase SpsE